jgi:hypothetical protein
MSKKLQITLDEEATKKYMEWATRRAEAEGSADMEPCGRTIMIEIGTSWMGSSAFDGGGQIEFGDCDVELV